MAFADKIKCIMYICIKNFNYWTLLTAIPDFRNFGSRIMQYLTKPNANSLKIFIPQCMDKRGIFPPLGSQ